MRRYLPPSAVNGPVWLGVYTTAMTINRLLTICAAVAVSAAGTLVARAQQGYPIPTAPIYSPDDPRYGRPTYSDRAPPMPTGPILSPDDPRYGRPVYSDRAPPL